MEVHPCSKCHQVKERRYVGFNETRATGKIDKVHVDERGLRWYGFQCNDCFTAFLRARYAASRKNVKPRGPEDPSLRKRIPLARKYRKLSPRTV